jgi:hypothetical protein
VAKMLRPFQGQTKIEFKSDNTFLVHCGSRRSKNGVWEECNRKKSFKKGQKAFVNLMPCEVNPRKGMVDVELSNGSMIYQVPTFVFKIVSGEPHVDDVEMKTFEIVFSDWEPIHTTPHSENCIKWANCENAGQLWNLLKDKGVVNKVDHIYLMGKNLDFNQGLDFILHPDGRLENHPALNFDDFLASLA